MRVTMMLCDAAQVADGKLYILGGGWSLTGPGPVPSAVAIQVHVPWDQANRQHHLELALIDDDSQPVFVATPEGDQPVKVEADFEVGRPVGIPEGSPIEVPMAFNIGPLPLPPDRRFVWEVVIDGQGHEDWRVGFGTRPAA